MAYILKPEMYSAHKEGFSGKGDKTRPLKRIFTSIWRGGERREDRGK